MNKPVTVRDFLKTYDISREEFMAEINKDKDFYDTYIEWENLDSDSIITPKALARLGEIYNEPAPEMTVTIDGEVKDNINLSSVPGSEALDKPKRKRRTKAEMEEERKKEQDNMNEFMDAPVDTASDNKEDKPVTQKQARKKKSKLNITKQFIQEHGRADMMDSVKNLRKFLMNNGRKAEEVALMDDEEVKAAIGKDFYIIEAEEGTYYIKRSALIDIMSDIYLIERD